MTGGWVALLVAAPFAVAFGWLPVAAWRGQRRCDRLNAANTEAHRAWAALTDTDRAWLLANGATRPSRIHWELR